MKIKRFLRRIVTAYMIGLASMFPILTKQEQITKNHIERIEEKEEDLENNIIKDKF